MGDRPDGQYDDVDADIAHYSRARRVDDHRTWHGRNRRLSFRHDSHRSAEVADYGNWILRRLNEQLDPELVAQRLSHQGADSRIDNCTFTDLYGYHIEVNYADVSGVVHDNTFSGSLDFNGVTIFHTDNVAWAAGLTIGTSNAIRDRRQSVHPHNRHQYQWCLRWAQRVAGRLPLQHPFRI